MKRIEEKMDKYFGLFMEEMQGSQEEMHSFRKEVNDRFDRVEKRLDTLEEDVRYIRKEIYVISGRVEWLYEQIGNIPGFAKEIDDLRSRIAVIEQTLIARA